MSSPNTGDPSASSPAPTSPAPAAPPQGAQPRPASPGEPGPGPQDRPRDSGRGDRPPRKPQNDGVPGIDRATPPVVDFRSMKAPEFSAEMQADLDAAMADLQAEGAAAPKHDPRPAPSPTGSRPGIRGPRVVQAGREHRTGRVVSVGPTDIFVEFGPKELGIVPRIQYPDDQLPAVGSELQVVVDKFESTESLYICSRPGSVQKADWEKLEPGQVVEARVTGVTKGGLELEVAKHRAFMPASQATIERVPDLSVFVGELFKCEVVRVERMGSGNIVLSRRNLLEAERKEHAEKLKNQLQEGQSVEGTVRKIMPFGAFVDLGGIDGLIHISDMTYDRTGYGEKSVEKYVKEGQRITVRILKLDWDGGRISLGMKQLAGDPFQTAVNQIVEGAEVTGRVTKILEFGCFVEIAPGVEGLVHISELDHKRVNSVAEVVKQDQIISCKVLKIDPGTRRVSLSIKATKPLPEVSIGGGGGGMGGRGGKGKDKPARSAEEILKETPALRRMRAKAASAASKGTQFKGGLG